MVRMREWDASQSPTDLSEALFAGEVVAFRGLAGVAALTARVRALLAEVFDTDDPQRAEGVLPPDDYRGLCIEARRAVDQDAGVASAWAAALAKIGYPTGSVYGDRIRLRIVPSRTAARGRRSFPLPAHRDTWGANLMAQINWWLPLYPLAPTRTMCVWPALFTKPVANTGGEWDFDVLTSGAVEGYPILAQAIEDPAEAGKPVMIDPGDLIAFSAAHLHGSLVDDSGTTRLSLDTRTFWDADVDAGRGAPDVDGGGGKIRWEWFTRLSDGENAAAAFGAPTQQAHHGVAG